MCADVVCLTDVLVPGVVPTLKCRTLHECDVRSCVYDIGEIMVDEISRLL